MKRFPVLLAAGLMALAAPILPALAHHSFAMFDFSRTIVVRGVVTEFRFVNPHTLIRVRGAPVTGGAEAIWTFETMSPGNLGRIGWNRRSFIVGERVEVTTNPLRSGERGGAFGQAIFPDSGEIITWGEGRKKIEN